jgi:hypothetical protein
MHSEGNTVQDCIPAPAPVGGGATESVRAAPRARQPWGRLLNAVLDLAGGLAELVRHDERDWASAVCHLTESVGIPKVAKF